MNETAVVHETWQTRRFAGEIRTDNKYAWIGGCFVVLSADGLYWTGAAWSADWKDARQWSGPGDPSADADLAVNELLLAGISCSLAYIPSTKVILAELPRLERQLLAGK
jgi:hypothetical protein